MTSSVCNYNSVCDKARSLCRLYPNIFVLKRCESSFTKKFNEQERRKDVVHQYAGLNNDRAIRLYGWGVSETGALGLKTLIQPKSHQKQRLKQLTPLKIDFFRNQNYEIKDVSCGYGFSLFVCRDSTKKDVLLGSGVNTNSQIGFHIGHKPSFKDFDLLYEPNRVFIPLSNASTTKFTHIACGHSHSVIVTDNEGIFTLGNNAFGQCGRKIVEGEIYRNSKLVNHLEFDEEIQQVVCGQDHTLILTKKGEVYSCGLGSNGQTGLGHFNCTDKLTLVEGDIKGEKIVNISSKSDTVLAVSDKGDIFGWGNTEYDQFEILAKNEYNINTPTYLPFNIGKIKLVAAAKSMCAAVNEENKVFTWGHGILGRGPTVDRCYIPEQIPSQLFNVCSPIGGTEIKDIQCGLNHFIAITKCGNLYSWGKNKTACLGLANMKDQFFPWKAQIPAECTKVVCGVDHTFVISRSYC